MEITCTFTLDVSEALAERFASEGETAIQQFILSSCFRNNRRRSEQSARIAFEHLNDLTHG